MKLTDLIEANKVKVTDKGATFYKDGEPVGGITSKTTDKKKLTKRAEKWYDKNFKKKHGEATFESSEKAFPAVFQGITNGRYKFTDKKGNPHYLVPMMVGQFKDHLEPGMKAKLTYKQVSPNYADYAVSSVIYEDVDALDHAHSQYNPIFSWAKSRGVKLNSLGPDPKTGLVAWSGTDVTRGTHLKGYFDLQKNTPTAIDFVQDYELDEGFTDSELQGIFDRYEDDYMRFKQTGELDGPFYDELYSYFADRGEMPYEVMKARTVDPTEWIADRIEQHDVDEPIKHEDITTEAPDLVDRVWGTDKAVSLKDKWDKLTSMDWLFGDAGKDEDTPRFNAEYTKERLKRSGFNDEQINQIRDMVTQAMKAAVQWGQRRFGLSPQQFATDTSAFAVYRPKRWDDIKPEQLIQINKMARQLLARKLEKGGFSEAAVGAPNPASQNNNAGDDENSGEDERFARNLERVLGKELDKSNPGEIKTAKQKLDAMRTEGKNMKDKKALREDTSINNMTINMDVQAHGPEDSLELLRKLSGLPVQAPMATPMPGAPVPGAGIPGNEPVTPGVEPMAPEVPQDDFVDLSPFDAMPDDSDMAGDLDDPAVQDMGMDADMGMDPAADAGMDVNVEPDMDMGVEPQEAVDEGEEDRMFNNSPHEETFSADAQIKQGTDLNRPKQQFKKEYPGDNPMAVKEAKELGETLYKRYVMSVVESLSETPVTDEEDRRVRCQELGRHKQDQKAMQDPAIRAAVLKKWQELRCGE